jgi:hypothetical protein
MLLYCTLYMMMFLIVVFDKFDVHRNQPGEEGLEAAAENGRGRQPPMLFDALQNLFNN